MDLINEIRIDNFQEAENILKACGSEELFEKAHQDGDIHPKHPNWVWVSSANGGKGDWRTLNGRAHKKHSETQASNKFLENFKNASDDVLEKIVSGKIQAVDRERKLAQQILDSRKKKSIKSGTSTDDLSSTKINLSVKDFKIEELDDEYGDFKNAPLKLHEYVGKSIEYYDENGKKQKATPFINEFYASSKQDKVGGYEIRFNRADPIGTFKTLNEAVTALNNWMNKMRVPGHGKPKWIYNQSKGDYQMNYSLDVPYEKPKANNVLNSNSMTTSTAPVATTDKLKSVLAATDGVYDEEKRKSNLGAWERDIQKYIENVAVELGKQIGVPFRKNWQGETEVKLGEYSSKDGGSQVEVTLDYDRGIQTYVSHSMAQSAKRTRKGGMVMCIYYPGHGGSCKTINLTEADNAKLKNIVKALKDVNKVKIKDLKNVQGYNSEQKTYNLLVKTLKKYNI